MAKRSYSQTHTHRLSIWITSSCLKADIEKNTVRKNIKTTTTTLKEKYKKLTKNDTDLKVLMHEGQRIVYY